MANEHTPRDAASTRNDQAQNDGGDRAEREPPSDTDALFDFHNAALSSSERSFRSAR